MRLLPLLTFVLVCLLGAPALGAEHVVLSTRAKLFQKPDAKSDFVQSKEDELWVMRLVSSKNGWLEVENVVDINHDRHCYSSSYNLEPLAVRFWVKKSDLEQVVVGRVKIKHSDGTSTELRTGTAVRKDGADYMVKLHDLEHRVSLTEGDLGDRYTPEPNYGMNLKQERLNAKDGISVNGQRIKRKWAHIARRITLEGDTHRLMIRTRCAEVGGTIQQKSGKKSTASGMLGSLMGHAGDVTTLQKGAALHWPDGTVAGTLTRARVAPGKPVMGATRKKQQCFRFLLYPTAESTTIVLCVKDGEIKTEKRTNNLADVFSEGVLGGGGLGNIDDALKATGPPSGIKNVRVTFGSITVTDLNTKEAMVVLWGRKKAYRQCALKEARKNAFPGGMLLAKLAINTRGYVSKVTVTGAAGNSAIRGCIRNAMVALKFPKPDAKRATIEQQMEIILTKVEK